jgi:acyl carrier protein
MEAVSMDMTFSATEDRVKDILIEELFIGHTKEQIRSDDPLRQLGVDSLGFVELRNQIELKFKVAVPDTEFTPENFATISTVAKMIDRYRTIAL